MLDLENLLKLISKEKTRLTSPVQYKEEELALLSSFLETEETDLIKVVHNTDSDIVVRAVLLANNGSSFTLDEINRLTEKNKQINDLDPEYTLKIIREINKIKSLKMLERIKALVRKEEYSEEEISTPEYSIMKNIQDILLSANCSEYDLESLLSLSTSKSDYFRIALPIVQLTKKMYQPITRLRIRQDDDGTVKVTQQQIDTRTKYININGSGMVAERAMQNSLLRVKAYYEKLKSEKRAIERNKEKELQALENLEKQLPLILKENQEITTIKDLLNRITSKEIRLNALRIVYLHNKSIYEELFKEYKKLSSNKKSKYKRLLNDYDINVKEETISYIMLNSLEDVKTILSTLTKLGITNPNTLLNTLTRTNLNTINNILTQINKGIISKELVINNPSLLCFTSIEYKNFTENLNYLQEKNLNPHYFRSNQSLLLENSKTIKASFEILENYDLLLSLKTGIDCSFLINEDLELGIDLLLELGYESFLEESLSLLNYQNNFKRLLVLKSLNIPVTSLEELENVLKTDKFLIPDSKIDDYIYNATPYNPKEIESENDITQIDILEDFSNTKRTYLIGGILISKNKFKRNFTTNNTNIDSIFYSIIKDSYLSDEEVSSIRNVLYPLKKIKKQD